MAKTGKRLKVRESIHEACSLENALAAVIGGSGVKFDETVEAAIQLGVDPKKSDQAVRGAVVLPAGSGRVVRVGVVAQSEADRSAATTAGADVVGFEDLITNIGNGEINFDVLLATPESMRQLAAVAKTLGPKGLMPNPKSGTVTKDVATAVKEAKSGQVRYRADKSGIVHAPVGKASFTKENLKQNIESLLESLKKAKPSSSKGVYLRRMALSATMGRSVRVDITSYR